MVCVYLSQESFRYNTQLISIINLYIFVYFLLNMLLYHHNIQYNIDGEISRKKQYKNREQAHGEFLEIR